MYVCNANTLDYMERGPSSLDLQAYVLAGRFFDYMAKATNNLRVMRLVANHDAWQVLF